MTRLPLILELKAQDALTLAPVAFDHRVSQLSATQKMALADDMINHLGMPGMEALLQRLQEIHIAACQGDAS